MILERCPWCLGDIKNQYYHDSEWGNPNFDENSLLFSQDLENRPYQDQDAINLLCDEGVTLHTSTNITKEISPL